ncbi:MAG: ABC transporter substrate-binding protein [Pseudomonadota bacterium]|nr:ABC transporter substrate-binding protein [Pseudomonadota bacterium]
MRFTILKALVLSVLLTHGTVQASAMQTAANRVVSALAKTNASLANGAKAVVFGIVLGATACGVTGCDTDNMDNTTVLGEAKRDVVMIGFSSTLEMFDGSIQGAELAVQQINASGGIDGRMVELVVRDVGLTPEQAVAAVNGLIDEGVHVLVGPEFSTQSVVVSKIAQQAEIPMLTTASTNPAVTDAGDMVSMATFTDDFQGLVMAELAANELDAWTAAVITQAADVYSEGLADTFTEHFMALEGSVVVRDSFEFGEVDFGPQLERVAAANPDVLFVPAFQPESSLLVKQAREMGITAIALGADGWATADLLPVGGEALNGSYYSDHFSADIVQDLSADTIAFISAYSEAYGVKPDALAALSYDAIHLMAQAIDRANSLIGWEVAASLANTQNYSGATFLSHFDENRHPHKDAVVNSIQDGAIVLHGLVSPQ